MNYQELIDKNLIDKQSFLLEYYHLININEVELVILLHIESLIQQGILITTEELEKRMSLNINQIDKYLKTLLDKKYIYFNDYNTDCLIDTSNVYTKIIMVLNDEKAILEQDNEKIEQTNIIVIFEQEFNRKLSPFEKEIIREWYDTYNNELILYALRQAVMQGVLTFAYIRSIIEGQAKKLYE